MTTSVPTCREIARAIDEPIAGTAAVGTTRWLLIEQPAPWGSHVVKDILEPATRDALAEVGITPIAVRTATRRSLDGPLRLWLADSQDARLVMWTCEDINARDVEVVSVAHSGCAPERAQASTQPLLLVCTNGKRDACCAVVGRQLMTGIEPKHTDLILESSHLGGHRFAGVTLLLPAGYMYRCDNAVHATAIIDNALIEQLHPHGLRGRCGLSAARQCAELAARQQWGEWQLGAAIDVSDADEEVHARAADGRTQAFTVEQGVGPVRPESCGGNGKPMHWLRVVARASQ